MARSCEHFMVKSSFAFSARSWLAGCVLLSVAAGCDTESSATDTSQASDAAAELEAGVSDPLPDVGGLATDDGGTAGPEADAGLADPGLVSLRRLNRTHYNNTVRDLLGTQLTPADDFPAEDLLYGFDNIAEALSVSTLLVEGYERAAEALVLDLLARPDSEAYARFITCDVTVAGQACAQETLERFATEAWRRPVASAEVEPYVALFDQGSTPEEGLKVALQGVLLSTNFIFRIEIDPDPNDPTPHPVTDHELASRLSYLLWGSMPDATLLSAAQAGELHDDQQLQEQLERMLTDIKVGAFVTDMAGLWLEARNLTDVQRDVTVYPAWSTALRQAMRGETESFLWELFRQERPLPQLLTADFITINEPLAELYGIDGVTGNLFQSVPVDDLSQRRGVLTQASFLTVTSHPHRTSPALRGKWVLDHLLCTPPPPPPPEVNPDLDNPDLEGLTLRERLEQHQQADGSCYACHAWMDPIGLGLQHYDPIGAFRTEDEYGLIDASGELPGSAAQPFDGAGELSALLAQDPRFERCVTEQITTYGLGRKPSAAWLDAVLAASGSEAMGSGAAASGHGRSIKSVLRALVMSPVFRTRRAGEVQP